MSPRFLVDTNVVVYPISARKNYSEEQTQEGRRTRLREIRDAAFCLYLLREYDAMCTAEFENLVGEFARAHPDCLADARIWAGLEKSLIGLKRITSSVPTAIGRRQWDRQTAVWASETGSEVISYDRKSHQNGLTAGCQELGVPLWTPSEWLDSSQHRRDRYPEFFVRLREGLEGLHGLPQATADAFLTLYDEEISVE
jgi:hypothetical protein